MGILVNVEQELHRIFTSDYVCQVSTAIRYAWNLATRSEKKNDILFLRHRPITEYWRQYRQFAARKQGCNEPLL